MSKEKLSAIGQNLGRLDQGQERITVRFQIIDESYGCLEPYGRLEPDHVLPDLALLDGWHFSFRYLVGIWFRHVAGYLALLEMNTAG